MEKTKDDFYYTSLTSSDEPHLVRRLFLSPGELSDREREKLRQQNPSAEPSADPDNANMGFDDFSAEHKGDHSRHQYARRECGRN